MMLPWLSQNLAVIYRLTKKENQIWYFDPDGFVNFVDESLWVTIIWDIFRLDYDDIMNRISCQNPRRAENDFL